MSPLEMIANARELILVDMFLFNDFQGQVSEDHRNLSAELTQLARLRDSNPA